jgi:hypothetical protein
VWFTHASELCVSKKTGEAGGFAVAFENTITTKKTRQQLIRALLKFFL